jgi:hypothetical protein
MRPAYSAMFLLTAILPVPQGAASRLGAQSLSARPVMFADPVPGGPAPGRELVLGTTTLTAAKRIFAVELQDETVQVARGHAGNPERLPRGTEWRLAEATFHPEHRLDPGARPLRALLRRARASDRHSRRANALAGHSIRPDTSLPGAPASATVAQRRRAVRRGRGVRRALRHAHRERARRQRPGGGVRLLLHLPYPSHPVAGGTTAPDRRRSGGGRPLAERLYRVHLLLDRLPDHAADQHVHDLRDQRSGAR